MKSHIYFYHLFVKHQPFYFFLFILQNILNAISYILLLQYSVLIVVDGIGKQKIWSIIIQLIIIFLFSTGLTYSQALFEYKWTGLAKEKMECILFNNVFDVMQALDLKYYESLELYDSLILVKEVNKKLFECLDCLASIVGSITGIVGLSSIFLLLSPEALFIIILTFLLNYMNHIWVANTEYRYETDSILANRNRVYLEKVFFTREYINEVKLNSLKDFLLDKYSMISQEYIYQKRKHVNKLFVLNGLIDFVINFVIGTVLYNLLLIYQVIVLETLSIGAYAALYFSATSLLGNLNQMLENVYKYGKLSRYLENIKKTLEIQSELNIGDKHIPNSWEKISVKNVNFYYDEKKDVLKNINVSIQTGKTIAIVGNNGGGKSTLVKLILRLYDPISGQVDVDDQNIKLFKLKNYRNYFATLFQDFNIYAIPLINNVSMNHIYSKENLKQVSIRTQKALTEAGFQWKSKIDLQTCLDKRYEMRGTYLSKGEQQKIGIARVLFADKKIVILDEPVASLDPKSELEFNSRIQEFTKNRTLIMISHRLSTTRNADQILVVNDGQIVEEGNHDELMQKAGYYAQMYELQASKFSEYGE